MPLVTAAGIEAVAARAPGSEEDSPSARGCATAALATARAGTRPQQWVFPRMFGAALTPPIARDLVRIARDWDADLLVHDQAKLAAPLVAAVLRRPGVTHSFGTAVPVVEPR